MAEKRRNRIGIIGAGIIGLSTAIRLQDADPSLDITIIAEKFSPDLTSDGAAGFWEPVYLGNTPIDKPRKWGRATMVYLQELLKTPEAASLQMSYLSGFILYDEYIEDLPFKDEFVRARRLLPEDLKKNFPSYIVDGFFVTSVMFPATPYLKKTMKTFQQNGGKVIQGKVKSFDELAGKFDVVVNCTGLGSYELCQDKSLTPSRGQILKVKAPWLKHFLFTFLKEEAVKEEACYIFPRTTDVVIGGTTRMGNWSTDVDINDTRGILKRMSAFEPTIKNAEIIESWVGLRPVRTCTRLEKEVMKVKTRFGSETTLQVVHNYGHGGAGLSVFWGCAEEARDLVLSSLAISHL